MCIPHSNGSKSNGYFKKEKRIYSHVEKPSEDMMKKGDPDFIDERIFIEEEKKRDFCQKIVGLFKK